jgi:two-component system response regulator YesN
VPIQLLIVDDDAGIVRGISDIITNHFPGQFTIHTAADGIEAFRCLGEQAVSLIITDIRMPGIDGLAILDEIKRQKLGCEVLMISAYDDFSLVRKALRNGAYDYLLKPVNIDSFVRIVADIMPRLGAADRTMESPKGAAAPDMETSEFFNLPGGSLSQKDLEDMLRQAMSAALALDSHKTILYFDAVFDGLNGKCGTEEEIRKTLIQFVYTLMDRNQLFIRVISSYKLTEYDIISCVKNLPTIEQIKKRFCDIMQRYINDLKRDTYIINHFLIKKSKEYIDGQYSKNLTLAGVANHLHRHPNYVSFLFKSQLGITFRDYLRKIRIEESKSMMKIPPAKINDIALRVGYQDVSHFNRAFKKVTGLSPSDYRRRILPSPDR